MFGRKKKRSAENSLALNALAEHIFWLVRRDDHRHLLLCCGGRSESQLEKLAETIAAHLQARQLKVCVSDRPESEPLNEYRCRLIRKRTANDLVLSIRSELNCSLESLETLDLYDGAVLFVEAGRESRSDIKRTMKLLTSHQLKVCGTVLLGYRERVPKFLREMFK